MKTTATTRILVAAKSPTGLVHVGILGAPYAANNPQGAPAGSRPWVGTLCHPRISTSLFGRGGVSGVRYLSQTGDPVTCKACARKEAALTAVNA